MGHDPGMDLHADPAALRAAAAGLEAAAEELRPAVRAPGLEPEEGAALAGLPGGAAVVAEHDRLLDGAGRTRYALAELAHEIATAAAAVAAAEDETVRSVLAVGR